MIKENVTASPEGTMASGTNPTRIGVDIGGTFTDLVWVDEATGAVRVGKLLTTPKDPSQAVEEGVAMPPADIIT